MLSVYLLRFAQTKAAGAARALTAFVKRSWTPTPSRRIRVALIAVDRRTLADIGIGPGEILSVAREVGQLRRPPHF